MQTLVERLYENKPLMFAAAIIAFLIAALLLLLIIRMLFGGRLRMPGGRTRQARLGIVDAFDLDRQRQLIIIRRDNTEHLIMIGGPNDVLIESEIIRVEARDQREARRDKIDGPGPMVPIGSEPRIPAPFAPVERAESPTRSRDVEPAPPSFSLDDQPLPSPLPPPIPASSLEIRDARAPQLDPALQQPRAPTFPLPPRRPQPPAPERRPTQPRPIDRVTRTEPAAPSLDLPPLPPPAEPPVPVAAVVPVPSPAPATPQTPTPRPAPPPFLRPLPPRPPKILQRTTPSVTPPPATPVAVPPQPVTPVAVTPPPVEPIVEPVAPPVVPAPAPTPPAPTPPVAAPPVAAPSTAPNDTLESLEEEMAKLLGRGSSE